MTAVTKIVLRSQWGWWGGVKKLFKWINSPSLSLLSPPTPCSSAWIRDGVNVALRGSCRRCASAFAVFAVKHEPTPREQIGLSDLRGDLAASSGHLWSSHRAALLYSSPGSGIFPCQGFHPNPLLPFSRHLPRRLRCIPLLTSRLLMPFSIDHYPPPPSPPSVSAQSERLASWGPPSCGRCSWEARRLRLETFGCLLWFNLWGPCAVASYWQIWVAGNDDSHVAQSYCSSVSVWTYRVSVTAGVFAVDEVPRRTKRTILWSDKHRRLVEKPLPSPLFFSLSALYPRLTWSTSLARFLFFSPIGSPPHINIVLL